MQSDRRKFLQFLAASPLFANGLAASAFADGDTGPLNEFYRSTTPSPIKDPARALNVFDFEDVARLKLPPAHYGYLAAGVDDDRTLRQNRLALERLQLRMRRLSGLTTVDASVELFGEQWETPIILAPTSSQAAFHPDAEIGTATAARAKHHLMLLSTFASSSLEEVRAAYGAPFWFQLYPSEGWDVTQAIISRAETVGCQTLVLTVDLAGGSNRETMMRMIGLDNRDCSACHTARPGTKESFQAKPVLKGLDYDLSRSMSWDLIRKIKDATKSNLLIKGIVTAEDARRCLDSGADGIIVSNHGGRATESGRATIDCLSEVVAAVDNKVPVLIDSGFRRGTDIFKALALGAQAVCVGRPYLWGLASFGQPGVETVLALLRSELERTMRQAGTASISDINSEFIAERI